MDLAKVESLCREALQKAEEGNHEQALALYSQALHVNPDSADAHNGLAFLCFRRRHFRTAAAHFRRVTQLAPGRASAFINLGVTYFRLGWTRDALAALQAGIRADPNSADGYYNLGLVYRKIGQVHLAAQAYREALLIDPRHADAHNNLANLHLETGSYALAVHYYRAALQLRPDWQAAADNLVTAQGRLEAVGPSYRFPAAALETSSALSDSNSSLAPVVHDHLAAPNQFLGAGLVLRPGRVSPDDPQPQPALLAAVLNHFATLQQQAVDHFHQTLTLMGEMCGKLHREQMGLLREELDRLRELTQDLMRLQAERSQLAAAPGRAAPRPAGPTKALPNPAPEAAPPNQGPASAAPSDVHAWLCKRIDDVERERQGRWQRLLVVLLGRGSPKT